MSDDCYDTAQVCMNGHVVTTIAESSPVRMRNFCEECGEKTITKCSECNSSIRGHYSSPSVLSLLEYELPKHCGDCGDPYPWTERKAQALKETVQEFEEMSAEDISKFRESVTYIVSDTPMTKPASIRLKSLIVKMTKEHQDAIKDLLAKVACEVAKAHILG